MYGKRSATGSRAKMGYVSPLNRNMFNYQPTLIDMFASNNMVLEQAAQEKANDTAMQIDQQERDKQIKEAQRKQKEELKQMQEKADADLKKKAAEEEAKKHQPQAMTIDTVPSDYLLKEPTLANKAETPAILQKSAPIGSKTTYYTQYI